MLRYHSRHFAMLAALLFAAHGHTADAYRSGLDAFKQGDYNAALAHFQAARDAGVEDAALRYNIAVTHYKLGQYNRAEQQFEALLDDARWGELARYNLGLVAERQGDLPKARYWYGTLSRSGKTEKLQVLAQEKLRQLPPAQAAAEPAKKWLALLSAGAGWDSNAASLTTDLQNSSSDAADYFTEYLVYGHRYLSGEAGAGVKLYGLAYSQRYRDYDDLDTTSAAIGFGRERGYAFGRTEIGAMLARIDIGSDRLAHQAQLKLEWRGTEYERGQFSAAYLPSYFDAGSHYRQIEGWQHRVDLGWRRESAATTVSAVYRFEDNARDDLDAAGSFYSYSPTRNGLILDFTWALAPQWQLVAGADFTHSRYAGKNRLLDSDGARKNKTRRADKYSAHIGGIYDFDEHWHVIGKVRYTDNDDNFELYTYRKREASLAVEYQY